MEYVQSVLVQIAAASQAEAAGPQGLLTALDAHRQHLREQPGFRGLQIGRSATPEGNLLVSVETRWRDANSLADYSTQEPNVASIVNAHQAETVPGTLQVMRLEAESAAPAPGGQVYDRLAFALFVPLGVLAFALLVIYGLSRIYLDLPNEAATPLAAVIALAILGASGYLASHPVVPRWQIAGMIGGAVLLLAGGSIAAAVYDKEEEHAVVSPTAVAGSPTPGTPGAITVQMGDNFFQRDSEKNPTITVKANQQATIDLVNTGIAAHNMHVASGGTFSQVVCRTAGNEPCSNPASIAAGTSGKLTFTLAAGTYDYRCDFHPVEMKGTIEAQ